MTSQQLFNKIKEKKSFLCIGLDSDMNRIPNHLKSLKDPVFEFNKQVIDATHEFAVAYKPNVAFYESLGSAGWNSLKKTLEYARKTDPKLFMIADAKRGDIGNTSRLYAKAFFENMDFDAVTVAPYMGIDSVLPFLEYEGKWIILLALTSNTGANDFQFLKENVSEEYLFEKILKKGAEWGTSDNLMFVVGATRPEQFRDVRKIVPDHFLLVPGVGAQGGSLEKVVKQGMNKQCGLLVNSSRGIIFAGKGKDFASRASEQARLLQKQMAGLLQNHSII